MRLRRLALVLLVGVALAGCGASIAEINERPDKWYQQPVSVKGRVTRLQTTPTGTLLELAGPRGARLLVRAAGHPDVATGDWVEVKGILVPETRVGDVALYDVVDAETVDRASAPRIPDIR